MPRGTWARSPLPDEACGSLSQTTSRIPGGLEAWYHNASAAAPLGRRGAAARPSTQTLRQTRSG